MSPEKRLAAIKDILSKQVWDLNNQSTGMLKDGLCFAFNMCAAEDETAESLYNLKQMEE